MNMYLGIFSTWDKQPPIQTKGACENPTLVTSKFSDDGKWWDITNEYHSFIISDRKDRLIIV